MAAIGIDLGTTNSCVAVYRKNKVEVIVNNEGNRVTPSFVSFTEDDERLVGDAAKHEASTNFGNTLFQMKRFIGRTHDDPIVQADIKMWPFHVIDDNNKPKIEVRLKNNRNVEFKREILSSEDVSAMVLGSLRDAAEVRLHPLRVTGAVITVPAYFNNSQRKATLLAGKIAGLNVLQMINEPTAAAIAYEMDREGRDGQNALIFDLGGGTFDVSIVTIHNRKIEVKAVGGDTHLGGDDFDNRLIEHCVAEFNEKNNCDMSNDKIGKQRLRRQCEEAKRMLSAKTSTTVQVDALHNGITFKSRITRAKFEDLNYDLFSKITPIIESTLLDAEMKKKDIDSVVLIGGSTRIPKVRQIIENLFGGNKLNMTINPDEAVAWGAAVLADKLSSKSSLEANKLVLQDVAPLSLGWKDVYDGMVTVVKRNTKIPTEQWGDARTTKDDQISARFQIYEGERPAAEDNHFLGSFLLDEIPAAPKGVEQLKIFFNLDENGILTVKARIASTGREKQITIGYGGRFDDTDVELMVKKAENFKIDDAAWQDRKKQVNTLEEFAYSVKRAVGEEKFRNVGYQNRQKVIYKCNEIISWIDLNRNPGIYQTRQKTENLEETCGPVFSLVPGGIGLLLELKK